MSTANRLALGRLVELLQLEPHPEGGFYKESFRSEESLSGDVLPTRYKSTSRCHSTAIYYLLTRDCFSTMHRLQTDEVYHFYLGAPVEMLNCFADGSSKVVYLGADIENNQHLQYMVPANTWQGSHICGEGDYALLGTTMAPGFDFSDYEEGVLNKLLSSYPDCQSLLSRLTRK